MSGNTITTEALQTIVTNVVLAVLAEQGLLPTTAPKAVTVAAPKAAAPKAAPKAEQTSRVKLSTEEREQRKTFNRAAAAWMREKGLVPSGQAWKAVTGADPVRNVATLRKLNEADGLTAPKAKAVEAEVEAEPAKPAAKPNAKPTAKAPKARTRKAAPKTAPAAPEAEPEAPTVATEDAMVEAITATFTTDALALMEKLRADGLSDTQVSAAMAAAGIA